MTRKRYVGTALLFSAFLLVGMLFTGVLGTPGTALAQEDTLVEMTVESSYNGLSDDGSQAIELELTFEATQKISGLRVEIRPSEATFLDPDSFKTREGQGVEVTALETSGAYRVDEIASGQTFSILFEAYPRRLEPRRFKVANVLLTAKNPQTYDRIKNVRASIAESNPYKKATKVTLLGFVTVPRGAAGIITLVGLIAIVGSIAFVAYEFSWGRDGVRTQKNRGFVRELRDLRGRMEDPGDRDEVDELLEKYRSKLETGGAQPGGAPPGGPDGGGDSGEDSDSESGDGSPFPE